MDVFRIIEKSFNEELQRRNISLTISQIEAAKAPFDFDRLQNAVDSDLRETEDKAKYKTESEILRIFQLRKRYHEQNLSELAKKYVLYFIKDRTFTESRAYGSIRTLKESAGKGCDIYPCERR